ncbi:MAG: ROK family protein [Clostridia bacterium]|nr:ROK family protein [Clostridia bacterium]
MKIGIDVGGSHIGLGIIDSNGNLLLKTEKDYDIHENDMSNIVLDTIKELLNQILKQQQVEKIESIGIAFPGTVSNGVVVKAENLGIENFRIVEELKKEFNIQIYLENDAKCAAIAEKTYGSLKEYDDSLFLIIGTGVGGAAFLNGKLLKPKRYSAFEVGHMVIQKGGEKCNCGRNGCFEAYASMKRLKEKIKKEFNLASIDGKLIKQFMIDNKKNEKLNEILDTYIEDLSIGIANLINILEPEAISIGGSFAHYKEILLERLENKLAEKVELYNKESIPKIVLAELKNDAGIIGAAMQI